MVKNVVDILIQNRNNRADWPAVIFNEQTFLFSNLRPIFLPSRVFTKTENTSRANNRVVISKQAGVSDRLLCLPFERFFTSTFADLPLHKQTHL